MSTPRRLPACADTPSASLQSAGVEVPVVTNELVGEAIWLLIASTQSKYLQIYL